MTVLRRRGKWIVDVYLPGGRRVRRVSPVQTQRGAKAFEAELLAGVSSTSTPSSNDARSPDEETPPPAPQASAGTQRLVEGPVVAPAVAQQPTAPGFSDFAVEWLETYAVVNNKASEVVNKESALRVHLVPFFGNRPIDTITARQIERYKAAKLKGEGCKRGPLRHKTINNHLVILGKLLRTAMEWGLLEKMPSIKRLNLQPTDYDWLRPKESKLYLKAAARHYPQWRAFLWTSLRSGLRRGEVFALQWRDLDFEHRHIHVRHSVFRGKLEATKSHRKRVVPMSPRLHGVLERHAAETHRPGCPWAFPNEDGQLARHLDHIERPHHGSLKAAGLRRIRFHDLRHTFASQLVLAGRPLKEVQELLGHASIQQTMRYAHLAQEKMVTAVAALDDLEEDE